jgi:hypothetical protein
MEGGVDDPRLPFDDAKCEFLRLLQSRGWPTELRWVSRDRLASRRRTIWVFRPEELIADAAARAFYEAARRTPSSLRIDALGVVAGRTLAYIEDYGGEGRHLNFGVRVPPPPLRRVSSRAWWACLRLWTRLLGGSPFLVHTRLTPRAA